MRRILSVKSSLDISGLEKDYWRLESTHDLTRDFPYLPGYHHHHPSIITMTIAIITTTPGCFLGAPWCTAEASQGCEPPAADPKAPTPGDQTQPAAEAPGGRRGHAGETAAGWMPRLVLDVVCELCLMTMFGRIFILVDLVGQLGQGRLTPPKFQHGSNMIKTSHEKSRTFTLW